MAGIDREAENIVTRTEAEITKLKADYEAQMAALDSQRIEVEGKAAAEVTRMTETAKSNLFPLKIKVFQDDNDAFLRYSLAEQLNPKLILRLFHSGPGTLWTNMGDKNFNLFLLPAGGAPAPLDRSRPSRQVEIAAAIWQFTCERLVCRCLLVVAPCCITTRTAISSCARRKLRLFGCRGHRS